MKNVFLMILACFAAGLNAQGVKNIGVVTVKPDDTMLSIHVSANTPELNALVTQAFKSHGRYNVVVSGGQYDAKFTLIGSNQVRVDITRSPGAIAVVSQTVPGTDARNALLRAADLAVEKTNLLGLKGFFASKIAFISERTGKKEVCTSDLFMGEFRVLTHDNSQAITPRWSPDGRRLVYTSFYRGRVPDIFVIDIANNYQRSEFASYKGTNAGARFSPNGAFVAMSLSPTGNSDIYVGNSQGRGLKAVTHGDSVDASPCFSPDSGRIVYTSDSGGLPQLFVISVSGGTPSRLSTGYAYSAEPDWSRGNPNKIAFTARVGRGYQIGVYDMSTRSGRIASKAPFDGIEPNWLADGRHILYTARTPSQSTLCILDSETGRSTPVSPLAAQAMMASVLQP